MLTLTAGVACSAPVKPAIPYDAELESQVDKIVGGMSLQDKVGQMCQLTVDMVTDFQAKGAPAIDKNRLKWAFGEYKVGSILNVPFGGAQSPQVWRSVIKDIQDASMKYIGVPDIYGVDEIHGTTYTAGGILFPQEVNMAASFNRGLTRRIGEISAYETRASSIPWSFAPVMDVARNAAWPRVWESFGEDPYLNGQLARELVIGMQGTDPNRIGMYNVAACAKHYMAYGAATTGKDRTPSSVTDQDMREKYFYAFKESVEAGVLSVMVNSGMNKGVPFHANKEYLTGWLKDGLNWDGVIVTDWADINNVWKRDRVAKDYKEAIMLCINAGIDMAMTPYDVDFCTYLTELVNEGKVPMSRIDDAVKRIIRLKLRLNLWKDQYADLKKYPDFASEKHAAVALDMALQSEVLLKNEGILPLAEGTKILITGPNADTMRALNGGWSYTWQGSADKKFHEQYNTILEAMRNRFGADNVTYVPGVQYKEDGQYFEELTPDFDSAVAAASGCDVIVACIGENSYCETPGNTDDITLSANQTELVKRLAATGKPVVLILNEGRPRVINKIVPLAKAVVDIMLPGNYGADALAQLLAGDANFCAKLPFTYPRTTNSLHTYDYKPMENQGTMQGNYNYDAKMDVEWEFGDGLSYTTYSYSNMCVDRTSFASGDILRFTVDVTNTGDREGMEPVLLYSSDLVASVSPDVKRLRAFDKVSLKPGETKSVTLEIPADDLAFVGYDNRWILEEGEFTFLCGGQHVEATCSTTKVWDTPNK